MSCLQPVRRLATGFGTYIGFLIKEKLTRLVCKTTSTLFNLKPLYLSYTKGSQTEILEAALRLRLQSQAGFLAHFEDLLKEVDLITISGSLPSGMDDDLYATIIEKLLKQTFLCF